MLNNKAVILHGTDGNPNINWLPWLKEKLISAGYEVWVPDLPDNHKPNRDTYNQFLKNSNWDFRNNIVIGHSSGATTVLNLLQTEWFPEIKSAILVGTFLNEKLTKSADWYKSGQFDGLFPQEFNVEKIKSKAEQIYFIHGNDDPYCDINDAKSLCNGINGNFIEVNGGLHLSSNRTELPEIIPVLEKIVVKNSSYDGN